MSVPTLQAPPQVERPGASEVVPPAVPASGARLAAVVAVLVALVAVLAVPAGPLLTTARFASLVAGPLEVRDGTGWRAVPIGERVADGTSLRAVGAAVTLDADGDRLVLASGARASVDEGRLTVERGSVLIDGSTDRTVVVDGVTAVGRGTWRVDAGRQARLATYDGELVATDGSAQVALATYRQVTVRDRTVSAADQLPLRYLATDPFDREQLGEALRVDDLAAALGRSLRSTYGDTPRDADFYAAFVAVDAGVEQHLDDLAPVTSGRRFGPPSEVLLGMTVADAVAELTGGTVAGTVDRVATMRERGASWGLLVVAAGGGTGAFSAAAERLLEEAAADPPPAEAAGSDVASEDPATETAPDAASPGATGGAGGGAGDEGVGSGGGGTGATGGTGGGSGGSGGGGGGGGDGDAPLVPTEPVPPAPDPSGPLAPVEDAVGDVEDAVGDVGDALDGAVEDTTDAVGDVIGGVDDLLAPSVGGLLGGG